jgi:Spy/CpxP family protein refolding chaperone
MKRIFVMTTLWVALITLATAQEPGQNRQGGQGRGFGTPEERAKNQTERLDKLVKLTDEQKTKISAINLDLSKKTDAEMKENRENREALRSKMSEINTERDKQYKAVLTENQFKQYQEDNARREKQRGERGNGQRGERN